MKKSTMNEDIKKYPIFLFKNGELIKTDKINLLTITTITHTIYITTSKKNIMRKIKAGIRSEE